MVFITERLRVQLRRGCSLSGPDSAPPNSVKVFSFFPLGLLITLTELQRLTRSWSPQAWSVLPTRFELPLHALALDDTGEEFDLIVLEDSLQFEPETDVGI